MTKPANPDEWRFIKAMFPRGWQEQARTTQAFIRARYAKDPEEVMRILLFHAVRGGLRDTVAQAKAAGLMSIGDVGLLKRLRTSAAWLRWIAKELCQQFRQGILPTETFRLRAVDSTKIQGPANTTSEWRLHYTLDLHTLACDWQNLTPAKGAEALESTPVVPGDVLIADRNYFKAGSVSSVVRRGAHVLVRMKWNHPALLDSQGLPVWALSLVQSLRVGKVGQWGVFLKDPTGSALSGRIVALKLPRPLAEQAVLRLRRTAKRKQRQLDPRSVKAAHYVMVFTTLPETVVTAKEITELYRFRWQIEIAFKRLKQLLKIGRLPHQDPKAAQTWILAKVVVALLLELYFTGAQAPFPPGDT